MKKEQYFLMERLHDLAEQSLQGESCFSPFLSIEEQDLFLKRKHEFNYTEYHFHLEDETLRRMICFGEKSPFPIIVLECEYQTDIGHRDVLGAFMNLGTDRSLIGNILIDDKVYIEVHEIMHELFMHEIRQIKREKVHFSICDKEVHFKNSFKAEEIIIPSERLDCIIAAITGKSRSMAQEMLDNELINVVGKEVKKNILILPEDVFSIRGYGKYIYRGIVRNTKKGRIVAIVDKFT